MNIALISLFVVISIIAIIILTSSLKLHAFVALFVVSVALALAVLPVGSIIKTIKEGFGATMGSIGFLIIFGAMIGITLDKTGATISIANYILSRTGVKRSAAAIGITGFITGLPIFCDSGFIILSGLAKSFSIRSGTAISFMVTVLATSLYAVHCLIPPHPGALAAAGIIDANIGYLVMTGTLFAIPGALAAYFWSRFFSRAGRPIPTGVPAGNENKSVPGLPPVFLSFLPIVVPLLLITIKSLTAIGDKTGQSALSRILAFPGEPVIALFIGVLLSLLLVKKRNIESLNALFSEAVVKAGPILIITAAGGMFGLVIKSTGVGEAMGEILSGSKAGILVPFLMAAIMKTAQGSSTVAIITAASFVSPMLPGLGLDSEWGRLFAMLAMGSGSMVVSHANDSYFWVVTNFGEISVNDTLKVYTTSTLVMGIVVFLCVWLSSAFLL
ncbi:MAG TPA: GntP family permease [Bacteroidales bacterium]|jgi:GntP family gluconate:H+ symporter|nr:GntP family permease [Bacteroidales bacterium]HNR42210.1 GntP family permease [Bacteroidales bacterium]